MIHPIAKAVLISDEGDPGGITLVTDVSHPDWLDKSGHLFLRKAKSSSLGDEELNYLQKKGVFAFPKTSVCDALVRLYFHHVHPFFPIINAKTFLVAFEEGQYERIGIHLLWSVFLAASLVSCFINSATHLCVDNTDGSISLPVTIPFTMLVSQLERP